MSVQWLEMRITEEKDRRAREAQLLERLPSALEELHTALEACVAEFTEAFGRESAEIHLTGGEIHITTSDMAGGTWRPAAKVDVICDAAIPGFRIDRPSGPLLVGIGPLPGNKVSYREMESDQYLTAEELTRHILDRALFPKLVE
jgi:hypothetical protein